MQLVLSYYRQAFLLLLLYFPCFESFGQHKDAVSVKLAHPKFSTTKSITIKGNIKRSNVSSPNAMDVYTFQYRDLLTGKMVIIPISKDPAGNFSTTFPLSGSQQIQLNQSYKYGDDIYQEEMIEFLFYAEPGEDMELNYYVSDDFKTRSIKFGGNLAKVNNQNRNYQDKLDLTKIEPLIDYKYIDSLPSSASLEIIKYISSRLKEGLAFNSRYFSTNNTEQYVRQQTDADMQYVAATALVYAVVRKKVADTNLISFFDEHNIILNDPKLYNNDRYKIFLGWYYLKLKQEFGEVKHLPEMKLNEMGRYILKTQPALTPEDKALAVKMADTTYTLNDEEKKQAIDRLTLPYLDEYESVRAARFLFEHFMDFDDTFLRDLFVTRQLNEAIKKKEIVAIKPLIAIFKAKVRASASKDRLLEQYRNEYMKVYESKLSSRTVLNDNIDLHPDSVFSNLIKKHKNKVIYLDVWATWCKPCLEEMPNSKLLQEKLSGKDVVFVYVCIDSKSKSQWMNLIAANKMEGDNYFLHENQALAFSKRFNINSIPRYMIINRNGKLENEEAPRPGDKLTLEKIKAVL